jgi:CHAD domain-containing protein
MGRDARLAVEWDDSTGVAANARTALPKLAEAFFAQVRRVLARNPKPARLHPLRVSGKRLRYSLDLFRPCYGSGLDERIDALRRVQDLLGQVNDSVVSLALIRKSMRRSRLRTQVERFAGRRAAEKAKAFRRHWQREFDAPGREEWWTGFLSREAHSPECR